MRDVTGERIGSTLRKLAEDLVTERRRVVQLKRENGELRAELEALRRQLAEQGGPAPLVGCGSRDATPAV